MAKRKHLDSTSVDLVIGLIAFIGLSFLLLQMSSDYFNQPDVVYVEKEKIVYVAPPFDENGAPLAKLSTVDYKQISCLAQNMYHEARGQVDEGIEAVGLVTINRMRSSKFPSTICGVVYQAQYKPVEKGGKLVPLINKCHFSWYCDGKSDKILNKKMWEKVYDQAVHLYLKQNTIKDITHGATYYHATYVHPYWAVSFKKTVKIQDHIFYAEK